MPSTKAKSSYSIERSANPGGGGGRTMTANRDYSVNLSVQQVLSLWVQGTTLQHFTGMRNELSFRVLRRNNASHHRRVHFKAESTTVWHFCPHVREQKGCPHPPAPPAAPPSNGGASVAAQLGDATVCTRAESEDDMDIITTCG